MALTKIQGSGISGGVNLKAINGGYTGGLSIEDDSNTTKSAITHVVGTMAISANASTDHMLITADGEVTMPSQPCFQVKKSATQSSFAINTLVQVVFPTERFDVGSNFASNTFTAPVTGKYQLNAHLLIENADEAANYYQLTIQTSNMPYYETVDPRGLDSDVNYLVVQHSSVVDMDANDTAVVNIYQSGGSQQSNLNASTCVFSGALIC